MTRETDELLYDRFLNERNSDDLRALLERYRESFTLFLYGYVHSMDDAEDIMLNAFAVAVSGTARFSGKSSFKTWLFAIGRNLAKKHMRSSRFTSEIRHERLEDSDGLEAENELLVNEDRRELYAALSKLPDDYRNVLCC